MGHFRHGITIAAVIGVLVLLAVALYLILEPLHRDDEDGARTVLQVGYTLLTSGVQVRA